MSDSLDIAWAAGFLDGEGCFRPYRRQPGRYVAWHINLSAGQTRPAPIWKLHDLFGGSISRHHAKECDYWRLVSSTQIADLLPRLIPYLTVKQSEAKALLAYAQTFRVRPPSTDAVKLRETIYEEFLFQPPPDQPDPLAKEEAIAWCAGFLDAEGCFSLNKISTAPRPGIRSVSVGAYQKYYRVPLLRLADTFGVGRVSAKPNCAGAYNWHVRRASDVVEVVAKVERYLVVKHEDARIVHDFAQELVHRGKRSIPQDTLRRRLTLIREMEVIRA